VNRVAVAAVRTWPASAQWSCIDPVSFRGLSRHSYRNVLLSRIRGATDKPPAWPSTRHLTVVLVEGGRTDGRVGHLRLLLPRGLGAVRGCGLVGLRAEGTRTCSASAVKGSSERGAKQLRWAHRPKRKKRLEQWRCRHRFHPSRRSLPPWCCRCVASSRADA
jgi:hypothetical protein